MPSKGTTEKSRKLIEAKRHAVGEEAEKFGVSLGGALALGPWPGTFPP